MDDIILGCGNQEGMAAMAYTSNRSGSLAAGYFGYFMDSKHCNYTVVLSDVSNEIYISVMH